MSRPCVKSASVLALAVMSAALLGACADNEQSESVQMMDRSMQSDLGQQGPAPLEEGSTDADAPPAARTPQQAAPATSGNPMTSGKYQWNGNPERVTVGTPQPDARRPIRTPGSGTVNATADTPPDAKVVIVQPGDTLHGIADRHNVTVASLTQANRLPAGPLRVGQRLVLPPVAR